MRKRLYLVLILLVIIPFFSGCIQLDREMKSSNYIIASSSVTEVTYLIGNDGLFTKEYVVTISTIGKNSQTQTYSRKQYESLKNSAAGYILPDF